ncbi:MAG: acetolactate synthase large subunit [Ferrimicrobium sp.]
MNGANALLSALVDLGVRVCFANPGTSEMHLVAAFDQHQSIQPVLTLYEGVATGAADGYGRIAGKPAATLLHLGPGLANGLANLHNARRAFTPLLSIVGDHASFHRSYDPPLTSDIESIARSVSRSVRTVSSRDSITTEITSTYADATASPSGVATLILPADYAWEDGAQVATRLRPNPAIPEVNHDAVASLSAMLRSNKPVTLILGGASLRAQGLRYAGMIATAFGATLLSETFPAVLERGAGIVALDRIAYVHEFAQAQLAGTGKLALLGAQQPVSFFAYPGIPSTLYPADTEVIALVEPGYDATSTLEALVDSLGIESTTPKVAALMRPELPQGPLTPTTVAAVLAAHLPEGAIVADEGNTAGVAAPSATAGCPPHRWMTLTGGAIGQGLPLATGAAIAAPDSQVVCLEADGSSLYTIQALWTQARMGLNVTTIILNNRSYNILEFELARVIGDSPAVRAHELCSLTPPDLNFVALAQGFGVDATRVENCHDFAYQLQRSFRESGPHLIEITLTLPPRT